jgi:hypothetical protein
VTQLCPCFARILADGDTGLIIEERPQRPASSFSLSRKPSFWTLRNDSEDAIIQVYNAPKSSAASATVNSNETSNFAAQIYPPGLLQTYSRLPTFRKLKV